MGQNRLNGSINIVVFALLLIGASLLLVSYRQIKKFAGRRLHTSEKIEKKEAQREILFSMHAGQPVSFISDDGIQLSGILFVRPQAKRTLLVAHGYRMTKERLRSFPELFPNDTILLFDIRTHGQSSGELVTFGFHEKHDIVAAVNYLQNNPDAAHLPLFGIGISMGSVAMLGAAAEHKDLFKAMVLDSPFAHLEEQLLRVFERKTGLPRQPFSIIMQKLFEYLGNFFMLDVDARVYAQNVTIPTMIIHAQDDRLVPVEDAYAVYDALQVPKKLWIMQNSRHARIYKTAPEEYKQRINLFFEKYSKTI